MQSREAEHIVERTQAETESRVGGEHSPKNKALSTRSSAQLTHRPQHACACAFANKIPELYQVVLMGRHEVEDSGERAVTIPPIRLAFSTFLAELGADTIQRRKLWVVFSRWVLK